MFETEKSPHEKELEHIFPKKFTCPCCDRDFTAKILKSGRVRREESDPDLRPRAIGVDILKYQIIMCPNCGYASLVNNFTNLSSLQIRLIRERVTPTFKPNPAREADLVSYDMALDGYVYAIKCAEAKMAKESEKAYLKLIVHWLLDSKAQEAAVPTEKAAYEKKSEIFYKAAYDGFVKAVSQEYFPMAGMDENTIDYLVAYMAFHFGQLEVASKMLSQVLVNKSAPRRLKDRALELKEQIVEQIKGK